MARFYFVKSGSLYGSKVAVLPLPKNGLEGNGVAKQLFTNGVHLLVVGFLLNFGEGWVLETTLDVVWIWVRDDGHVCVHG